LLQADIERSPHLALALPLRLARSLRRGRTQVLAGGPTRLRRGRLIRLFVLESLAKALQFENQRRALRPDGLALGFADPARRVPAVMQ
jgi:hypothetical protein